MVSLHHGVLLPRHTVRGKMVSQTLAWFACIYIYIVYSYTFLYIRIFICLQPGQSIKTRRTRTRTKKTYFQFPRSLLSYNIYIYIYTFDIHCMQWCCILYIYKQIHIMQVLLVLSSRARG